MPDIVNSPATQPLTDKRLGTYLINLGVLKETALNAALAEQTVTNERLGLILNRNGLITRKALTDAILHLNPEGIQGETLISFRVPSKVMIEAQAMLVAETDSKLYIATLGSEEQVRQDIAPYYPEAEIIFTAASHEQIDAYLADLDALENNEDSVLERLLQKAITLNVSDIHIIPRTNSYSVFFRYLGVRHLEHEGTLDEYLTMSSRIKDKARMDLAERRIPQDGNYAIEYSGKLVDLRIATQPQRNGESIVIRLLDPDRVQPSLDGIGISRVTEWRNGVARPNGLCLICGPTGSGKTTTLNASIKELDRFEMAISTLEDPVEYGIAYVNQININPALGLDFARGVRALMRQDPDVIVVGEIRDVETARNAIKAAETGHLVLGTLHAGEIKGVISRLRDLEVPAYQLRYLIRSILVQRLIRAYCTVCKGTGCPACNFSKYGKRIVVSECAYFPDEDAVTELIESDKKTWPTMLEDAMDRYSEGLTSREEIVRAFSEAEFNAEIKKRNA